MTRAQGGLLGGPGRADERLVAEALLAHVPEGIHPDSTVVRAAVAAGLRADIALVVLRRWVLSGTVRARSGAVVIDHRSLGRLAAGSAEGIVIPMRRPDRTSGPDM